MRNGFYTGGYMHYHQMTDSRSGLDGLWCDLLAPLIAKHVWGSPIGKDALINQAPIPTHRVGDAKDAFDQLRQESFITDCGKRGVKINTSNQGDLAVFLEEVCGWDPITIERRLKHYEGYDAS